MPPYFFVTVMGDQRREHDEPVDLPDDRAAWGEATQACGEILKDIDGNLKPNQEWRMEVSDEKRELLFRLRLIPEAFRKLPA